MPRNERVCLPGGTGPGRARLAAPGTGGAAPSTRKMPARRRRGCGSCSRSAATAGSVRCPGPDPITMAAGIVLAVRTAAALPAICAAAAGSGGSGRL